MVYTTHERPPSRLPLIAATLVSIVAVYVFFVTTVVFIAGESEDYTWKPRRETHRRGDDTPQAAFDTVQLTVTPTVGLSELHDHPGRAGSGLSDEGTASTDRKSSSRPGHSRATALLTSKPGPGLFHPAQDIHAVMPHLFRAAERFEQRPLRELGGRPAGSAPKTPCWFETSDDGGSGGGADEVHCLPGFYVLGAPKCGTSALYNVLRKHPNFVSPRDGKESHFWTMALGPVAGVGESGDRLVRNQTRVNGADFGRAAEVAGDAWPELLFGDLSPENFFRWSKRKVSDWRRRISSGKKWREQTGDTLWPIVLRDLAAVPELIRALQPAARLVVILRDPVERAASQYRNDCSDCEHAWKPLKADCACPMSAEGFEAVVNVTAPVLEGCFSHARNRSAIECNLPIAQWKARAFSADSLVAAGVHRRWVQWLQEGLYAETMRIWLGLFPRESLLVMRYEQLVRSPREELRRFLDHVGLGRDLPGAPDRQRAAAVIAHH